MILVADFVDRPEEIVETEIVGTPGGAAGSPEFRRPCLRARRLWHRPLFATRRVPVEDGDAFRPRMASDIARPQYVHSTLTPGFGRCAQIAIIRHPAVAGALTAEGRGSDSLGHAQTPRARPKPGLARSRSPDAHHKRAALAFA